MKEHHDKIFTCIGAKVGHLETIHIVIQCIRKYTKICM